MLCEKTGDDAIKCLVCSHGCVIKKGAHGRCAVRTNHNGEAKNIAGNLITAAQLDPVEKKPLYHFLPGSKTFSIGSAGCNFSCKFCQNHHIAAISPASVVSGTRMHAADIVRIAQEHRAPSVAFTYNEPTVFIEQVYDTAGLAHAAGLKTILVTNGFFSGASLVALADRIDAANIDLKGMSDDFYRHYCGGRLQPVLDNLAAARKAGWWIEVTTLLIPGVNDSDGEMRKIAEFVARELGPETPWHISAFHGAHKMASHPPTPWQTLENAWRLGRDAGLVHVYIGNAPGLVGQNTFCSQCSQLLIERSGYKTRNFTKNGICPICQTPVAGVFK